MSRAQSVRSLTSGEQPSSHRRPPLGHQGSSSMLRMMSTGAPILRKLRRCSDPSIIDTTMQQRAFSTSSLSSPKLRGTSNRSPLPVGSSVWGSSPETVHDILQSTFSSPKLQGPSSARTPKVSRRASSGDPFQASPGTELPRMPERRLSQLAESSKSRQRSHTRAAAPKRIICLDECGTPSPPTPSPYFSSMSTAASSQSDLTTFEAPSSPKAAGPSARKPKGATPVRESYEEEDLGGIPTLPLPCSTPKRLSQTRESSTSSRRESREARPSPQRLAWTWPGKKPDCQAASPMLQQDLQKLESPSCDPSEENGTPKMVTTPKKFSPSQASSLLARRSFRPEKAPLWVEGTKKRFLEPVTVDKFCTDNRIAPMKNIRFMNTNEKIYDLYYWEEVLQEEGNGGKVVVCRSKQATSDEFNYVMKIRSKESLREHKLEEQFRRLHERMLNFPAHRGVVSIYEVLEDDSFYYVVMQKANAGSFFNSLLSDFEDGCMPASAVKELMREIFEAVSHVHQQCMLHRDIKPDNIAMHISHDELGKPIKKVMLIDFDHADPDWSPDIIGREKGLFGTLRFNAPETLDGNFSEQSDLYSVGTILYLLMTGKFPYNEEVFQPHGAHGNQGAWGNWRAAVYHNMQRSKVDFRCSPWPDQPACRDLCQRLLAFDYCDRISSAEEALSHEWFSSGHTDGHSDFQSRPITSFDEKSAAAGA